jgi:hypothetical protein
LLDQENKLRDEESRRIVEWLSPLDFSADQIDYYNIREKGTGEWILDTDEFKEWINGSKRTLWCHGIRKSLYCQMLT